MENQRVFFTSEIEALKEEINELKRTDEGNKSTLAMKNQVQPTREQKSREHSAEHIWEEICSIPNPENENNKPTPYVISTKNTP